MVDYYRKIERSVTISADKRSTVDLQVDVWSADANITKFILKLDTSDSTAIDLTDATVTTALVYDGVILQDNGQVEEVATQRISYVLNERLRGYEGVVNGGFYVTLKTGQKIDIQNVSFNMRKSLIDTDLEPAKESYYQTFDDIVADVQSKGEKSKTDINAVVSDVNGYADSQKQAIHNIVSDVQSVGDTAKEDIKSTLPSVQSQLSELKEDLADIDYIVFKDKIGELTFNSEGSSSDITLDGNTITSINATKEQYKAFTNTFLFEKDKKYIVVMKFKNNSGTAVTIYANAFSDRFAESIGKTQSLGVGKSETSVIPYIAQSDIRGFSIYSLTENASYTADIYVYDVTDKDISNIDFSVGGTKIKILKSDLEKPYFGKILCTYGDSITAQQTWQDYVQRELGFSKYYNHGVGGRRLMAMATDECLAEITEDFDVMLVMGGANDWTQDRKIGTEADINTDEQSFTGTFYGGLNTLIKKLLVKYPTKRIVFMTQTPVKNSNGEAFFNKNGSADGLKNSNGNTTRDFARATLNACGNNHVPCIDLNSLVGWNENNISSFVKNENNRFFHPTSVGGKRMAECISGFLKSLQSIN